MKKVVNINNCFLIIVIFALLYVLYHPGLYTVVTCMIGLPSVYLCCSLRELSELSVWRVLIWK